MRAFIFLFCTGVLLVLTSPAGAANFIPRFGIFFNTWEGLTTSARLSALGGGDLADDDPSTLLVNPAPLGSGSSAEISYNHAEYFNNLDFQTIAAAVEISGFRLSLAQQDYVADSWLVRTAFNPEGTGDTTSFRERMSLLGLSYSLSELTGDDSSFALSVGMAWRKNSGKYEGIEGEGNSWDLGTSLRWSTHNDKGWASITGVLTSQNMTDEKYSIDDREASMPRSHRMGLTFESALRKTGQTSDRFKFLAAYSHTARHGIGAYRSDSNHIGAEVMFFDFVAARYGYNTMTGTGLNSWGIGVLLNRQWLGPFTIELDWGQMSYSQEALADDRTLWGFRTRYNF